MKTAVGFVTIALCITLSGCEKQPVTPATAPAGQEDQSARPDPTTRPAVGDSASTQPAAEPREGDAGHVQLFNGRDLTGWTHVLSDMNIPRDQVWSVKDGVLACTGKPSGYLRTERDDFENYVLTVDWRWPLGTAGGNNGVLVHASDPGVLGVWPRSIEVQLQKGQAGDFWIIGTELDVENEAERKQDRRHLNLTNDSEKPMGEWNTIEITCKGNEVIVKVNGELVNHATNCSVARGAICLQSEGAPIEYRNIVLRPL